MPNNKTSSRRGSPRIGSPHYRKTHRSGSRHPARRPSRRPARTTGRSRGSSSWSIGKTITAVVVIAALAAAGYFAGAFTAKGQAANVALQLIYTAPTANDAAITLPQEVKADLMSVGLAHQQIELTRVDSTGIISTSIVDLTPHTGNLPNDPILTVATRAIPVIDAKINDVEKTINTSSASNGDRALYAGLTKINFRSVPTIIVSSGLDLSAPDDARELNWSVPAQEVVSNVKKVGAEASLHGPVTFVIVPPSGSQEQLGAEQKNYRNELWKMLLLSAGSSSVRFLDATGTASSSSTPAPGVPVPALPKTPVSPIHDPKDPHKFTCTLSASFFIVNTPTLISPEQTKKDLSQCVHDALAAHARLTLDGWTSYEGPLTTAGKPVADDPANRQLSDARVSAIADILIRDLKVPESSITSHPGHGNTDQPNPDPRSEKNRVVVITYTIP